MVPDTEAFQGIHSLHPLEQIFLFSKILYNAANLLHELIPPIRDPDLGLLICTYLLGRREIENCVTYKNAGRSV